MIDEELPDGVKKNLIKMQMCAIQDFVKWGFPCHVGSENKNSHYL